MLYKDYNKLIHEFMDLSDRNTRRTLMSLEESDQDQILMALTSKLYDKIVEKVDSIDFGTIPRSRGDITKIENYTSLMECIDIIRNIVIEYKERTDPVDVVLTAIENIKQRTKTFTKAYALNVEMPIVLYNTIVLAIVSSVSFLITSCIEYIKDPGAESFKIALDKVAYNRTSQNLLFENLSLFNSSCVKGDIDVAMQDVFNNNRRMSECGDLSADGKTITMTINIHTDPTPDVALDDCEDEIDVVHDNEGEDVDTSDEGDIDDTEDIEESSLLKEDIMGYRSNTPVGFIGRAIMTIAKLIIPLLQSLVYYFYQSKQNVSDYFAIQSELIQMNAYRVQYNNSIPDDQRRSIYTKQMKIADNLKKISNVFSIDYNKASKSSVDLAKSEQRKFKADELGYETPANAANQSSLF